jgi:hypothetical protein
VCDLSGWIEKRVGEGMRMGRGGRGWDKRLGRRSRAGKKKQGDAGARHRGEHAHTLNKIRHGTLSDIVQVTDMHNYRTSAS